MSVKMVSAKMNGHPNGSIESSAELKGRTGTADTTAEIPIRDCTNDSVLQNVDSEHPISATSKSALHVASPPVSIAISDGTPAAKSPFKSSFKSHQASDALPPISDPGYLLTPKPKPGVARFARVGMAGSWDRAMDTPELPKGWSDQHDRAICYLDVRDHELDVIIKKLKEYFPELYGQLNVHMVDKRLRQLDQNLEITYWADAMRDIDVANNGISPIVASPTTTAATYIPIMETPTIVDVVDLKENVGSACPKTEVGANCIDAHSWGDSPADLSNTRPSRSSMLPRAKSNHRRLAAGE